MKVEELQKKIRCGETSRVQFKQQFTSQKQIAEEMVAFANSEGGDILFGIVAIDFKYILYNNSHVSRSAIPVGDNLFLV